MRGWALLALLALGAPALAQEGSEEPEPGDHLSPAETVLEKREWLKGHQSSDGGWSAHGFQAQCVGERCGGEGTWDSEVGTTGLALLAFLGYGETHRTPRYGEVVRRGSARLMGIQDGDGCFGVRYPERFVADHAMATLAMAELYGLTQSPRFRPSAERGVAFLLAERGADGGWRAGDRCLDSDVVTTAWAVSALRSARSAGMSVEEEAFTGAVAFLDGLTEPGTGGVRMDRCAPGSTDLATSAAVLTRIFCGAVRDEEAIARCAEGMFRIRPGAEFPVDPEAWYFGNLAAFQIGGDTWKRWNESMKKAIVETQVRDPDSCRWGSWDPVPGPSEVMGRVATTALGVMSLQVYYRYARVFGSKDPPEEAETPAPPSTRLSNRAAALDLDFPEPRTGFVR